MTDRSDGGARTQHAGRFLLVLVLLTALAAPVALLTDGSRAAADTPPCAVPATTPGILGIVPARATSTCSAPAAGASAHVDPAQGSSSAYNGGSPPLVYGGGAVVGTASTPGENTVHPVFWAPAGYSYPAGYEAGVSTYLDDVAADSGGASNVYAIDTEYTDGLLAGSPHLSYDVHAGLPLNVTDPYPTSGRCTPDTSEQEPYTACVTDAQIHTELGAVLTAHGLSAGLADIYLIIFPPDVETCVSSTDAAAGGTCSDTDYPGFCGYHSAASTASGQALYADIPFPTSFDYTCVSPESPHGSPDLDSTLSLISHEQNETITDPLGDAWIDSVGFEEADECAWTYGSPLGGSPGAEWNQEINGDHYYLQQEFSNEDYSGNPAFGCALTQAVPQVSVAITTAHPMAGQVTAFDGSASYDPNVPHGITGWSWDFGDGTAQADVAAPTHVYAKPGNYAVTLTVTDVDGFSAAASRQLTVTPSSSVAPTFTRALPPLKGTVGKAYSYSFAAVGAPDPTYALSGAPAWLKVNPTSGTVTGTPPTRTSTFTYSVVASNGIGVAPRAGPFVVTVTTTAGPQTSTHGYWLVGSDGGIFSFGSAGFHGSTGNLALQRPVVGITPTRDRDGYWLVASDGGIFAFGDSGYYGSLPGLGVSPAGSPGPRALAAPIVAMVPSSDGAGYFMVAADGGVFAFGDARFAGSCPGIGGCSGAAVAVMPDATGKGYWLVTVTGNVYAFGDARDLGAPAPRSVPVSAAVRTPDGGGYWVLFADGRVDAFGDARYHGDPAGTLGGDTATTIFATSDGGGYWVGTASGAVHNYGDAPDDGSMAGAHLNGPIAAAAGW